jgi:hypothetical protein
MDFPVPGGPIIRQCGPPASRNFKRPFGKALAHNVGKIKAFHRRVKLADFSVAGLEYIPRR